MPQPKESYRGPPSNVTDFLDWQKRIWSADGREAIFFIVGLMAGIIGTVAWAEGEILWGRALVAACIAAILGLLMQVQRRRRKGIPRRISCPFCEKGLLNAPHSLIVEASGHCGHCGEQVLAGKWWLFKNVIILGLFIVFLSSCRQENYWEQTLIGPFQGDLFNGQITTEPVSSIQVSINFILDVHWEDAMDHPIIRLRDAEGTSQWARFLVPRFEDEEKPRGRITTLSLREVHVEKEGFKVMFSCYWIGGGKEGGIIYLNKDHTFSHFSLGY